jgi:hypothetical protein
MGGIKAEKIKNLHFMGTTEKIKNLHFMGTKIQA